MARDEVDREDLLREATGLIPRIELAITGCADPVVVGFRRQGGGSIYWGADPVVQFNSQGELRRGYRRGRLLKAEQGRLIELTRERSRAATTLLRREFEPAEQARLIAELQQGIDRLRRALAGSGWRIIGQVPPEEDVMSHVRNWLDQLPTPLRIAARPHVG